MFRLKTMAFFTLILTMIGFEAWSQSPSCQTLLAGKSYLLTSYGFEEYQFADRLSVQNEAEIAVSVARVASVLPADKFKQLQSSAQDSRQLSALFQDEVVLFSKSLLKVDNPFDYIQKLSAIEAVSNIEQALREHGSGQVSVSAISLYQVLKNPDAAKESFRNLMLKVSPYFLSKNQLETGIQHLETNVELSGVLATLTGLGTAAYSIGGGGGISHALLFAAVAYGTGKLTHAVLKEFPYQIITGPIDQLRRRWLRRSLQRSLNQYLKDETDSVRLQLFDYRFKKWRNTIETNKSKGTSVQTVSNSLYETSMLLALDFPLLTFPIKFAEVDYKNLKSKQYTQLVDKFKNIVETRRNYLNEVTKVLSECAEAQKKFSKLDEKVSDLQTYQNQHALMTLIQGVHSAELVLEGTLLESVNYDRHLQILVESLQLADQKVESTMLAPLPAPGRNIK